MTIVRWTPRRDMLRIQDEMNRLFNNFVRSTEADREQTMWSPQVDIFESDDEISVTVEIPGMEKEDVTVSIQDNVLTLKGEKKQDTESKDKNFHRVERAYGSFERSFSLPSTIQTDRVKATAKDGVLTIALPKAEEAKPKEIAIAVK